MGDGDGDGDGSDADATPHAKDAMFTQQSPRVCCYCSVWSKRIRYGSVLDKSTTIGSYIIIIIGTVSYLLFSLIFYLI